MFKEGNKITHIGDYRKNLQLFFLLNLFIYARHAIGVKMIIKLLQFSFPLLNNPIHKNIIERQ